MRALLSSSSSSSSLSLSLSLSSSSTWVLVLWSVAVLSWLPWATLASTANALTSVSAPIQPAASPVSTAAVAGEEEESGNGGVQMAVQLVNYLATSVTRVVKGCGELWTNHGRCNAIRSKIKGHRSKIRNVWEEQGLFQNPEYSPRDLNQQLDKIVGGISYDEFAFLQKGKEDRGKVLNLLFLVFGAPRFLPYALMFNPEMLPSSLQPPTQQTIAATATATTTSSIVEGFWEKQSRQRSVEIIQMLLQLEKDARELPGLAKLNIFARKQYDEKLRNNQAFNRQVIAYMQQPEEQHCNNSNSSNSSSKEGAQRLLTKIQPYWVSSSGTDFSRYEKRLCHVPPSIVRTLAHCFTPQGFLSFLSPHVLVRAQLLRHLQKLEEADKFLVDCKVDLTTLSPRLLREACSDRLIGGPAFGMDELKQTLADWIELVTMTPERITTTTDATTTTTESTASESLPSLSLTPSTTTTTTSTSSTADGERTTTTTISSNGAVGGVYYNENVARVALLSYYALQATRDARNVQTALPRILFSCSSSSPPPSLSDQGRATATTEEPLQSGRKRKK